MPADRREAGVTDANFDCKFWLSEEGTVGPGCAAPWSRAGPPRSTGLASEPTGENNNDPNLLICKSE